MPFYERGKFVNDFFVCLKYSSVDVIIGIVYQLTDKNYYQLCKGYTNLLKPQFATVFFVLNIFVVLLILRSHKRQMSISPMTGSSGMIIDCSTHPTNSLCRFHHSSIRRCILLPFYDFLFFFHFSNDVRMPGKCSFLEIDY